MKKILFVMAGLALLTSCQDETLQRVESNAAISFENAFVAKTTRAAADPSTTTASITGFDVYGFMDQPSGQVFTGDDVTLNGGAWSYVNTQYWLAGHDYYFAALAPMNSENWSLDFSNANTNGVGTVTFTNVDGTEDLLYAAATASTQADDVNLGAMAPVPFTFNHLLSKLKFTFKNAFTNPTTTVKVTNLKMTAPGKATIDLATTDWWTAPEKWVLDATAENVTLDFGAVNDGVQANTKIPANTAWESSVERLTIPAVDTQAYTITFDVVMYQGDVEALVVSHEVVLNGKAFEMGKAYNLVTELNAMNIDPNATELYPIEFTVVEVKEWEPQVNGEVVPEEVKVGRNVATVADLEAAIAEGGNVVLQNDIVMTKALQVPAGKKVILDLNGNTLKNTKESTVYEEGCGIIAYGNLDIVGEGTVEANLAAVWARGNDGAVVNIFGGNYVGEKAIVPGFSVVYASGNGSVNIFGGQFDAATVDMNSFGDKINGVWAALNMSDSCTGGILVAGGQFYKQDPAAPGTEPKKWNETHPTGFVAAGYKSVQNGDYYEVVAE